MTLHLFIGIVMWLLLTVLPPESMAHAFHPILPRDSNPFAHGSKANPLDYAPDFSNDPFPPFPPVHKSDGSNYTAENFRATRLFGWKGCDVYEQKIIVETWKDFHKLANQPSVYKNIDWNSQAAKEFWGHSTDPKMAISDKTKSEIKQIFQAAQQVYDPWWKPPYFGNPPGGYFSLWIRVQCSPDGDESDTCGDPGKCPSGAPPTKGTKPQIEAYSEPYGWYSKITFCNYFFNEMKSLSQVMANAKKGKKGSTDLWNYQNRARVMFHEVLHLVYFMNTPEKSPDIDDVLYETK